MSAQSNEQKGKISPWQQLERANQLVLFNKNDSSLVLLEPIIKELIKQDLADTKLGLSARLTKARALEQSHNQTAAIQVFNELKTKSDSLQQWDIYAGTCLSLSHLYDKLSRQQFSKLHLETAQNIIYEHEIDSLYPSLFIRRALWNINFRAHPDSIQYYSNKALSLMKEKTMDNPGLRYSIYLILGTSTSKKDKQESINWYKKAVVEAKILNDPIRLAEVWNRISKSYNYYVEDLDNATAYNDSTIHACYQAIVQGYENIYTLHDAYKTRSRFFVYKNQWDSAFHYLNKGLQQENAYIRKQQFDRVAEVDAKYRDEKKTLQLQEQARMIQYEQRSRKLLLGIFAATLLLVIGLIFGLINHKRSIRKLADQNSLIQRQSEKLKSLDLAKSRFFANVSHELRTPLTLVLGPIKSALKSGNLNNRNFTLLATARQNAQNLLDLVGSILDLSKMEHDNLILEEKPELLFQLLRRIVSTFESHAQREGIELTFDYKAEEELQLQIDWFKLRNIVNNLLSNAVKFTASGGTIKVVVYDKKNSILLTVQDTGRGISSSDLPHVFDRFYQSTDSNAPTEGGTGIGLAYSKELAKVMGGDLWVESQLGAGSTFYLSLPRKEVLGVPQEQDESRIEDDLPVEIAALSLDKSFNSSSESTKNGQRRPTIMIVEDNYSLRDYLTTILEPFYEVVTARNGKDALQLLNMNSNGMKDPSSHPSLIISDVMMPVMDGFQLMEKLKSDDRFNLLPLIMLTARADIKDRLTALRIGVDDYIQKPFDEEELLARINNLLENYTRRIEAVSENDDRSKNPPEISQQDSQWLASFEAHIRDNLSNEMVNVPMIAQHFAMSESTLLRQLKSLTGLTPAKYIQEMRLDKARQMLENRIYNSVNQVSKEVGYHDARSFARSFKKRFGKTPAEILAKA